jgi:hypothetical protein
VANKLPDQDITKWEPHYPQCYRDPAPFQPNEERKNFVSEQTTEASHSTKVVQLAIAILVQRVNERPHVNMTWQWQQNELGRWPFDTIMRYNLCLSHSDHSQFIIPNFIPTNHNLLQSIILVLRRCNLFDPKGTSKLFWNVGNVYQLNMMQCTNILQWIAVLVNFSPEVYVTSHYTEASSSITRWICVYATVTRQNK